MQFQINNKYKILILVLALFPATVFAAGGGGGGSMVACDQDTWICTEWSDCSSQGIQKRVCSVSYDCPNIETTRPQESMACTPPCTDDTWECTGWNECESNGKQVRACNLIFDCKNTLNIAPTTEQDCSFPLTPTPEEPPKKNPFLPKEEPPIIKKTDIKCTQDRWDCSEWPSACDQFGNHKRNCKMTLDCPTVETLPPPFFKKCEKLQCADKPTLKDRVLCRLNLTPAAIAREYELEYLPEECKLKTLNKEKNDCIKRYLSFKPCWEKPVGEERSICAKTALGITNNASQEMDTCAGKTSRVAETCKNDIRKKTYEMIKFRFYDLEERAEDLIEKGADQNLIADFSIFILQKKEGFNKAKNNEEKKKIILDVREEWKKFVQTVKPMLKNL